jgi:hypothetical protein
MARLKRADAYAKSKELESMQNVQYWSLVFTNCRDHRRNDPKGGQYLKVQYRRIFIKITGLQGYNAMAIRLNTISVQEMRQDVWAITQLSIVKDDTLSLLIC